MLQSLIVAVNVCNVIMGTDCGPHRFNRCAVLWLQNKTHKDTELYNCKMHHYW